MAFVISKEVCSECDEEVHTCEHCGEVLANGEPLVCMDSVHYHESCYNEGIEQLLLKKDG